MLNWISKNKEWLFSGAGLALLILVFKLVDWPSLESWLNAHKSAMVPWGMLLVGLILGLLVRPFLPSFSAAKGPKLDAPPPAKLPTQTSPHVAAAPETLLTLGNADDYKERPTPKEIIADIKNQPILQRGVYQDSYKGHKVRWRLRLSSVESVGNGRVRLQFYPDQFGFPIFAEVLLLDYPELKRVKSDAIAIVVGTISSFDHEYINLDVGRLQIVAEEPST